MQYINEGAFAGCTSMRRIVIPAGTSIADPDDPCYSIFYGCSSSLVIYSPLEEKPEEWGDYWNYYCDTDACETHFDSTGPEDEFFGSLTGNETSVIIPDTCMYIPYNAFMNNSILQSVTIPSSVTEVRDSAFMNCTALQSVTIPASVTWLGDRAFAGCSAMTELTILGSDTSMDIGCFSECNALSKITVPSTDYWCAHDHGANGFHLKESGGVLYAGDTEITSVDIPYGREWLSDCTFMGCHHITSITIPYSVTGIGYEVFAGCSALTDLDIPEAVTDIGWGTFRGCTSLSVITIPAGVTYLPAAEPRYSLVHGCSSSLLIYSPLESKPEGWGDCWNYYSDTAACETHFGSTGPEDDFFGSLTGNETSVIIPDTCRYIPYSAFFNNSKLKSVTIPSSVTAIRDDAFMNCTALESVTIPASVTWLGDHAFSGCTSMTELTILGSDTGMDIGCFSSCSALAKITIPDMDYWFAHDHGANGFHLKESGGVLYAGDAEVTSAEVPDGREWLPDCTFMGCHHITSVTIPYSITSIGYQAFAGCSALTVLDIPEAVNDIGWGAFRGCTSLSFITIPMGVSYLPAEEPGFSLFYGCSSSLMIYSPLDSKPGAWGDYWNYYSDTAACETRFGSTGPEDDFFGSLTGHETSVIIPDTCRYIPYSAFFNNGSLESVTIPSSVTEIRDDAFLNCVMLQSVTIPASVTWLGDHAFSGCISMTELTITSPDTRFDIGCFSGSASLARINIPDMDYWYCRNHEATGFYPGENGGSIYAKGVQVTSAVLPDGTTYVNPCLFLNCTDITSVTLPDDVTCIGHHAFAGCTALTSVNIPAGVSVIESDAFAGCNSLTASVWRQTPGEQYCLNHLISYKYVIPRVLSLTLATASSNGQIMVQGEDTPRIISSSAVMVLPAYADQIGKEAFRGTAVQQIVIPSGCLYIASAAFYDCSNLKVVVIPASVNSIKDDIFGRHGRDVVICCTEGSTAHEYALANDIMYFIME